MKKEKKTNPNIIKLIDELKSVSRDNDAAIWKDVARRLEKPSSRWPEVNVGELERTANAKDTIVVAGKLLGSGILTKPINVAAFNTSKSAKAKVRNVGGKVMTIEELASTNPKGSGIRIMG